MKVDAIMIALAAALSPILFSVSAARSDGKGQMDGRKGKKEEDRGSRSGRPWKLRSLEMDHEQTLRCLPRFSDVVVFGDGLSDNGNLRSVQPAAPGRLSDGPVFSEVLSSALGVAPAPSRHLRRSPRGGNGGDPTARLSRHPPGNVFAVSGARSTPEGDPPSRWDDVPILRVPVQVRSYLEHHGASSSVAPDVLHVFAAGSSDVRDAIDDVRTGEYGMTEARARLRIAARSVADSISAVMEAGARYVLIVQVSDQGDVPRYADDVKHVRNVASRLTEDFNEYLDEYAMDAECAWGVEAVRADVYDLADVAEGEYGLTVEASCLGEVGVDAEAPRIRCDDADGEGEGKGKGGRHLFWNEVYPTAEGHRVLADMVMTALGRTVCESDFPKMSKKTCKKNRKKVGSK